MQVFLIQAKEPYKDKNGEQRYNFNEVGKVFCYTKKDGTSFMEVSLNTNPGIRYNVYPVEQKSEKPAKPKKEKKEPVPEPPREYDEHSNKINPAPTKPEQTGFRKPFGA